MDRPVTLDDGTELVDGDQNPNTNGVLYDTPTNLFVAGFIGSPAMNMVYGTLGKSYPRPLIEA